MSRTIQAFTSAAFLFTSIFAQAADTKPKYGPSGAPRAVPLAQSNQYFRTAIATDFWSLIGFYVPQFNPYSCSAASLSMVLNAARVGLPKTADDTVVTQKALLEKVTVEQWAARLSEPGVDGAHGTGLDRLSRIAEAAFKEYGFDHVAVKAIHLTDASAKTKKELIEVLEANEKSPKDFIIGHFNQQAFTDDADAGHIAPVGAYDAKNQKVLILDPDREYYEPYWISVDTFLAGMATRDKASDGQRGYLVIRVSP